MAMAMASLFFLTIFLWITLLFCNHLDRAYANRDIHYHTIKVSSLFPSASCKATSLEDSSSSSSLKLVHRYGPCTRRPHERTTPPGVERRSALDDGGIDQMIETIGDILREDQIRVQMIQSKAKNLGKDSIYNVNKGTAASMQAKSGTLMGSGNYVVTAGLGTPKRDLPLIFDTGSDITWTQCAPCVKHCYQQKDPIFDPSRSTSYSNISCTDIDCLRLNSVTGNKPGCFRNSTCVYAASYADSSYSVGFFAKEKLTLTPTDAFDNFLFGCGQDNQGLFHGAAGLMGLARSKLSVVEQTAVKYNKYFSYCLPSTESFSGHLTFGMKDSHIINKRSIKFTPLITTRPDSNLYGISILGIFVGGKKLHIPNSVFLNSTGIIDSGTVITRLPRSAYNALKTAFQQHMSTYPAAPSIVPLEACYNLSSYETVSVPKVGFKFKGGAYVELHRNGILFSITKSQVCLAFAPNSNDSDVLLYGNKQQLTYEMIYDVQRLRIGFGPNGCA